MHARVRGNLLGNLHWTTTIILLSWSTWPFCTVNTIVPRRIHFFVVAVTPSIITLSAIYIYIVHNKRERKFINNKFIVVKKSLFIVNIIK